VQATAGIPLQRARIASIGPVTSATARNLGLKVAVEANPYTIDGLVAAIVASGS
jgi:uroporphyrinogen-III synthase